MGKIKFRTIIIFLTLTVVLSSVSGMAFANSLKTTAGDYEYSTVENKSEKTTKKAYDEETSNASGASKDSSGDYEYELYERDLERWWASLGHEDYWAISITGYNGTDSNISIPDEIDGMRVVRISSSAFKGCTGLISIIIPRIVKSISTDAFKGCTGLKEINVSEYNDYYKSSDGVLFNNGLTEIITYPGGKEGGYIIPDSVKTIGSNAFEGCTGLTGVTIPYGVKTIGNSAFSGCIGLKSITIPNSVTEIEGSAFSGCIGLKSITITESVTEIGGWAFSGCEGLTLIKISDNI